MSIATYENFGIAFSFPENWRMTEEQVEGWPRAVSVESPCGGFWSLQVHEATSDPTQLVGEVLRTMRDEYREVEAELVREWIEGREAVGYDMHFYCLDLIVASQTRSLSAGGLILLLQSQAEDQDFDKLAPVFRAITTSLLRSLDGNQIF